MGWLRLVRRWLTARAAFVLLLVGWLALLAVTAVLGELAAEVGDCRDVSVLELEVAGSEERLRSLLTGCADADAPPGTAPTQAQLEGIRDGLNQDSLLFVPAYVALLGYWCVVSHAWAPPRTAGGRGRLRLGLYAAVLAGLFDLVENHALHQALDDPSSSTWPVLAFAASVPKFALVALATVVAAGGLREVWRRLRRPLDPVNGNYYRAQGASAHDRAFDIPDRPGEGATGIACSGGGIRSGTFCMGALQTFADRPWPGTDTSITGHVDRVTSVSGGGYFAGARQLLAHQGVEEPFAAGSLEEDHVRRHGRYLADSTGEWLAAGGRIVAGLVLNLGLIVLVLFVLARPVGWAQKHLGTCELIDPDRSAQVAEGDVACVRGTLGLEPQHWAAPGLAAGVALAFVVVFALVRETSDATNPYSRGDVLLRGAGAAGLAAVAAALVTLLVPGVSRGLRVVLDLLGGEAADTVAAPTAGTENLADARGLAAGAGTVFALVTTALRLAARRATTAKKLVQDVGADTAKEEGPGRWARAAQALAGVALALGALVLFAGFLEDGQRGPTARSWFGQDDVHVWLGLIGALLVLYLCADQTTWSLHSLYRRRLSTAFALQPSGGAIRELPYATPTELSTMGVPPVGHPKLVLCAAANLSGSDLAPPGRRAVSFTFEHDWVGSPQLGYLATTDYERCIRPIVRSDTTVLAAMAISGAAVASAMGRHSKGSLQSLLAVFNVRLGVWLPTPEFADQVRRRVERAPRRRRFGFLFREIFGSYDAAEAFTYVSDGGHYENLGLVELLRRRCRVVLCLDATGGPATLVEAVRLAETELGITIELSDEQLHSVRATAPTEPGDDGPLAGRLARSSILVARIRYPAVRGIGPDLEGTTDVPAQDGWLVYGRAVLTDDTPATITEYASGNPKFPNDPTGDQWFDADQFDNYLLLGRHVGARMAVALQDLHDQRHL